jgi:hypothetical protein
LHFLCQQELQTQGESTGTIPDDSILASVEAIQWVFLYLSIDNDACKILLGKPERKRPLGIARHRRVNNNKMYLGEIRC